MRAQYRAEARAEVEEEVRREWLARQPPLANSGDAGGSSSSSDWEAAEAQLSFATKILIWSQNQHRQNALRLTLHKLPALENLQDKTIRIKRSEVKAHMLDLFGTGGQNGLKQWSGPPATRRLLQAIRIEYIDQLGDKEDGVDQGGLSADLYDSFCSEVLADRTLFDVSEDGSHLPAANADATALNHLTSIGRVLAKQLLDGWVAPGPSRFVWHVLRESHDAALSTVERALDTLSGFDRTLAFNWRALLASPVHEYEYPLTLDLFTNDSNDAETAVTDDNKHEAVRLGCKHKLYDCRRAAFDALRAGFGVGEFTGLLLWSVPELVQLMHGTSGFDLRTLYADGTHLVFDEHCAPNVKGMLTSLLSDAEVAKAHGWGKERAKQFLQFTTAMSVLPPDDHGKSLRGQPIRVLSVALGAEGGDQQNTPQSSTCGRELYIPESYPNREWMVERLEKVFEHLGDGFRYA